MILYKSTNGERTISSTNNAEKIRYPHAKNKVHPSLTLCIKINSEWIHNLNTRSKPIKLLEENRGEKCQEIGFGNDFLDMTPKAQAMGDFPGGPVGKTLRFQCRGTGLNPWLEN